MAHVMAALDFGNSQWVSYGRDVVWALKDAGCTHYKVHRPLAGTSLRDTLWFARKAILPGCHSTVMMDNKDHDIGSVVAESLDDQILDGATLCTVHATGGREMFAHIPNESLIDRVVAVTVLTSMSNGSIAEVYGSKRHEVASRLAIIAARAGVKQFVCSAFDISYIREAVIRYCLEPKFFVPGIHLDGEKPADDQSATVTPDEAREAGAHVIIVGRAIMQAKTIHEIQERFRACLK